MRWLISFFTVLIFTGLCLGELKIPSENHIQNTADGLCAWCSIESLCKTHGYKSITGLTASKKKPPYDHDALCTELTKLGIKYRKTQETVGEGWFLVWQEKDKTTKVIKTCWSKKRAEDTMTAIKDDGLYWITKEVYWKTQFLFDACKSDLGVAVSIDYPHKEGDKDYRHMLVLTSIDENAVHLVDSNKKPGTVTVMPTYEFLRMYNGFAVVVTKP